MAEQNPSQSAATNSIASRPPRRKKRRWLRWLGGIVLLLILLVLLAPTLISLGIANGYIRSTINKSINGTVAIDKINLAWFGKQSVRGLEIVDANGQKAATIDVQVDSSLLKLIASRGAPMIVTISGTVSGKMNKDGSISFEDLMVKEKKPGIPKPKPQTKPAKPGEPFKLPEIPPATVNLSGVTLNWADERHNQTFTLDQLNGKLVYTAPNQPITIDLHGKTVTNKTPGSVDITGQASGLFDQRRVLSLGGASMQLKVAVQSIPLPLADFPTVVKAMDIEVKSDDLTNNIIVTVQSDAQVQDYAPGHLKADVAVSKVLTPSGGLNFNGASADIRVQGQSLPIVGGD